MRKSAQRKPKAKSKRARHPAQGSTQRSASLRPTNHSGSADNTKRRSASTASSVSRIGHAGRVRASRGFDLSAILRSGSESTRGIADQFARLAGSARTRAGALAMALPREDRDAWALLLAPFIFLALAIAGNQSFQLRRHLEALIARPVPPMVIPSTQTAARTVTALPADAPAIDGSRNAATSPAVGRIALVNADADATRPSIDMGPRILMRPAPADQRAGVAPVAATAVRTLAPAALSTPDSGSLQSKATPVAPGLSRTVGAPSSSTGKVRIAALPDSASPSALSLIAPSQFSSLAAIDDTPARRRGFTSLDDRCVLASADTRVPAQPMSPLSKDKTASSSTAVAATPDFGVRLARAAQTQLSDLVIYDDRYRSISYPLGDVPKLYGVCTDVVIRAYREVGIDLQVAVQKARIGSGDRNIDHRRTETLRRFFEREGRNLPVTSFAEDYLPGDIVTYTRPQNTGTSSRSHIAMVSDVIAPSGRPMILHNRGWGPQLEDGLFVDKITGHYRFDGQSRGPAIRQAAIAPAAPADRAATANPQAKTKATKAAAPASPVGQADVRLRPAKQRRPDLAAKLDAVATRTAPRRNRQSAARTVDSIAANATARR